MAHLAPEEAEQIRLHAEFYARFEVQPLLFALKLVDLDHDSLDLVLVALLIEVNFGDRRQLVLQGCVCIACNTGAPPDQVGVDVDLAYLH